MRQADTERVTIQHVSAEFTSGSLRQWIVRRSIDPSPRQARRAWRICEKRSSRSIPFCCKTLRGWIPAVHWSLNFRTKLMSLGSRFVMRDYGAILPTIARTSLWAFCATSKSLVGCCWVSGWCLSSTSSIKLMVLYARVQFISSFLSLYGNNEATSISLDDAAFRLGSHLTHFGTAIR